MPIPVDIKVVLQSPLSIARERRARTPEVLDHIPGSVLRGAILSAWYREHGEDSTFLRLISSASNRFPFLWPGPEGTFPAPRSAMLCKRQGAAHGMVDALAARARAAFGGATPKDFERLSRAMQCQDVGCGADHKPANGYLCAGELLQRPTKTSATNVGISRITGTAQPHAMYGSQVVEPFVHDGGDSWRPLTFAGRGRFEHDDLPVLEAIGGSLMFGKFRSKGRGRGFLTVAPVAATGGRDIAIAAASNRLTQILGLKEGTAFTLDVASPLIACDSSLRAVTDPASWLPPELNARTLDAMIDVCRVAGWDMAAKLPKDEEVAVAGGSVVLGVSPLRADALAGHLAALEERGIGLRTGEGFGDIRANDPIHLKGWED